MRLCESRSLSRAKCACAVVVALASPYVLSACSQAADPPPTARIHPEQWPSSARPPSNDGEIERRVARLLASLSLEEKVGQIIQADIGHVSPDDVRRYRLGAILNGGDSGPGGNDFAPAATWLEAADAFYAASMDVSNGGHAIPVLWGTDAVHGHNNIVGATLFPHNVGLGATRDVALVRRIGEITAREVRVTGQDWAFAPTLAVVQDVSWGRSYESYSQDPTVVRDFATAMVSGLQGTASMPDFLRSPHVLATAKHFVGDGGTLDGRDQGNNVADEQTLREVHAVGYPAAIAAGVASVMASYSSWHGTKLHAHRDLLTTVLKERMGFDGFVIGDWNGHEQVPGCSKTSCAAALNAGLDMFMAPDGWRDFYATTLSQVRSAEIPMTRLDDAVRRILRVKVRAGLFEAGKPSSRPLAGRFDLLGAAEHRAVARQAVRESLVLLKNSNHLLPLKPQMHVLIAGDGADDIARQSGGWTINWQGSGLTNARFPNAESIYAGFRSAIAPHGGTVTLSASGVYTTRPDVALIVYGEAPYAEFRGDLADLAFESGSKTTLNLLRKLQLDGIPTVSIFLSGRPRWIDEELAASSAFVAAWLPGSEGGGVADVLIAGPDRAVRHDFKGKLPVRWPRAPAEDGGDALLFPLGFGLTMK